MEGLGTIKVKKEAFKQYTELKQPEERILHVTKRLVLIVFCFTVSSVTCSNVSIQNQLFKDFL
jgi:hypothetical protein